MELTIEQLNLIWSIVITAIVPSVLWIIRKPLRELVKLLIKVFGGEMFLERFGDFEYIGTERGSKGELKDKISVNFLIYKNKRGFYKYIVVDENDKTIYCSNVFKTLGFCKKDIFKRKYTLYKGDIFDFF